MTATGTQSWWSPAGTLAFQLTRPPTFTGQVINTERPLISENG